MMPLCAPLHEINICACTDIVPTTLLDGYIALTMLTRLEF